MHAPLAIKQPARWRVIVAGICALILTVGLARFAYTPMLPIMREQAGLTHWAAGWLATVNYAGYMAGTLLAASINDLGRKYLIYRCGLVIAVVSTAGLLLASGLVLNWLIRQGHRPQLGLHFVGLGLGIAVSGVAVAALVQGLPWDRQWLGLGLLGIVFFGPAWLWMPPPVAVQPAAAHAASTSTTPPRRWMWLLIAAYFCAGFGFAMGATYTVAILVKLPLLADKGGWVWVIVGLAAAPSCFLWDRVADAVGQIRALMMAFGLQMVSVLMPIATDHALLNVGGAMLFGATFVGIVSLTLTLIGRCFPANPAKAMARMTLSYGVAQIIAPAMAGYIATASGSYHGALVVTALVMGCGVVALQALIHEEKRAAQAAGAR